MYVDTGASVVIAVASKLSAKATVNGGPDSSTTLTVSASGKGVKLTNERGESEGVFCAVQLRRLVLQRAMLCS